MSIALQVEGPRDGIANMARDAEMLAAAEAGTAAARMYTWDGPWVSLGSSQRTEDALLDPSHPWVCLRPTGGAAVLHGHDLTIGLAVPLIALRLGPRDVRGVYRALVRPLVEALGACGVPAALAETLVPPERHRSPFCFAMKSPNDIVHRETGAKVVGCALRVTRAAALLQASIPVGPPLVDPLRVLKDAEPARWESLNPDRFADALSPALAPQSVR